MPALTASVRRFDPLGTSISLFSLTNLTSGISMDRYFGWLTGWEEWVAYYSTAPRHRGKVGLTRGKPPAIVCLLRRANHRQSSGERALPTTDGTTMDSKYSKHQQNIIRNYYENRDSISLQRLSEL